SNRVIGGLPIFFSESLFPPQKVDVCLTHLRRWLRQLRGQVREFLFLLGQLLNVVVRALGIALRQRISRSLLVFLHLLVKRLRLTDELVLLTDRRLVLHLSNLLAIVLFTHRNSPA